MVLSATLTQDPSKLAQLDLHHPLFLTTGQRRYQLPEKLESYKLVCHCNCAGNVGLWKHDSWSISSSGCVNNLNFHANLYFYIY
jgi:hypothetical protein